MISHTKAKNLPRLEFITVRQLKSISLLIIHKINKYKYDTKYTLLLRNVSIYTPNLFLHSADVTSVEFPMKLLKRVN
jgi:hypothetical protein